MGFVDLFIPKTYWHKTDKELTDVFLDESQDIEERYDKLFWYFVDGFEYYKNFDGANASYPGSPSSNGHSADLMEGFTRILPMVSSWIASGRQTSIVLDGNIKIDLPELVMKGLLCGTNPESTGYWGRMKDFTQQIHESADIALSLWILKDTLWNEFTSNERKRMVDWLLQVNERKIVDNNWHHIPIIVNKVLEILDCPCSPSLVRSHYSRLKSFYRGGGWFSDGPNGIFDYYNAWGIHYNLFWLDLMDRYFDHDFINESLNDFVVKYKYFFSSEGIPIMGRSIFYRMAAPVPLIAAAIKSPAIISPGLAKRAFNAVWKYFVAKGAVAKGMVTQGYWGRDLRILDYYCGPATPLWSLRSLIIAYWCPSGSYFWRAEEEPLPVEEGDFTIELPEVSWKIVGFREKNEVQIINLRRDTVSEAKLSEYNLIRMLATYISGRPYRPNIRHLEYKLSKYSSLDPFLGAIKRGKSNA